MLAALMLMMGVASCSSVSLIAPPSLLPVVLSEAWFRYVAREGEGIGGTVIRPKSGQSSADHPQELSLLSIASCCASKLDAVSPSCSSLQTFTDDHETKGDTTIKKNKVCPRNSIGWREATEEDHTTEMYMPRFDECCKVFDNVIKNPLNHFAEDARYVLARSTA
jgi:hypothetical protein